MALVFRKHVRMLVALRRIAQVPAEKRGANIALPSRAPQLARCARRAFLPADIASVAAAYAKLRSMPATSRSGDVFSRRSSSDLEGSPSKSMIMKSPVDVRSTWPRW